MAAEDRALLLVLGLLFVVLVTPLVLGTRTLYFRDVFNWHLPLRALVAHHLQAGELPAFAPAWGLGQPLRGNPNAFAYFPDTLLFLAIDFWVAFNLHFVVHWPIAFFGFRTLARELGQSRLAATLAASSFVGGGVFLTHFSFATSIAVLAWWPWVLVGVLRPGARAAAGGGLACGLALLAGEPVLAALLLVPLALAAVERWGIRAGTRRSLLVLGLGVLVALPQLVATARVLPFTFRGGHGVAATEAVIHFLRPERLLELLVPFPFGIPGEVGPLGAWRALAAPLPTTSPPYYLSLHLGIPALALALFAARRQRAWSALALIALLVAWAGRFAGGPLFVVTAALFRYPEKLTIWFVWSAALLAGWGLDRLPAGATPNLRWLRWPAALAALLSAGLVLFPAPGRRLVEDLAQLPSAAPAAIVRLTSVELALAAGLAIGTAWAIRHRRFRALVLLEVVALLQLLPLWRTEATAPYRQAPAWLPAIPQGAAVVSAEWQQPFWFGVPLYAMPSGPPFWQARMAAADLHQVPGLLHGLRYPTTPDGDGLQSPLQVLLTRNLPALPPATRLRWLNVLGADAAVLFEPPDASDWALAGEAQRGGLVPRLYRRRSAPPPAWWPERVRVAPGAAAALSAVGKLDDPLREVIAARPLDHHPGGQVRLDVDRPDRLEIDVESAGGLLVLRRAYQQLYRASAGSAALATQPAQLVLLGVEVPPGRHRVVVEVRAWPERLAAGLALATAGALLVVLWRGGRRSPIPPPAPAG